MTVEQDAKRATGRTTRMMEYVLTWIEAYPRIRAHVCMIGPSQRSLWEREVRRLGFEGDQIQFVGPEDARIDWQVPNLRDPSCRSAQGDTYYGFFADHAVIEQRFGRHLQYMTQFDQGREINRNTPSMRERATRRARARDVQGDLRLAEWDRADAQIRRSIGLMDQLAVAEMLLESGDVPARSLSPQALTALLGPAPVTFSERGIAGMNTPPEPSPPPTLRQRLRGKK